MLYAIIITAVLLLAGVGLVLLLRRSGARGPVRASPPPVVFMPQHRDDDVLPSRPSMVAGGREVPTMANGPQLVDVPLERSVARAADSAALQASDATAGVVTDARGARRRSRRGTATADRDAAIATASSAASASATGTLRMLPGRLEVVEGHPADREIRFIAEPGLADQRFTVGRGEGPPNQHVRLQGQTVSRLHAALTYENGSWAIENLSSTNPLRVNGRLVDVQSAMVPLTDGDLIELGEVVLRYRA
jgi:hypothetical protein